MEYDEHKLPIDITGLPTEERIRTALYDHLVKTTQDAIVECWKGWITRTANGKFKKHYFHREFDVAQFHTEPYTITLTGYEVKGCTKEKKKTGYKPPAFAEGIDQAQVLLWQGADLVYLVIPEPQEFQDSRDLQDLCKVYSRVGVIFPMVFKEATSALSPSYWVFSEILHAPSNIRPATPDRKKEMLTSLATHPMCKRCRVPESLLPRTL